MSLIVHAFWSGDLLHLWAERADARGRGEDAAAADPNEFILAAGISADLIQSRHAVVMVPCIDGERIASPRAQRAGAPEPEPGAVVTLGETQVPAAAVSARDAGGVLEALDDAAAREPAPLVLDDDARFYVALSRMARRILVEQRFVPMLRQSGTGGIAGAWLPWTGDEDPGAAFAELVRAMPASARAGADGLRHDASAIALDFLSRVVDSECRAALNADGMHEVVAGRELVDPHVAWLSGLLGTSSAVDISAQARSDLTRRVRAWIASLEDRGSNASWRMCLSLEEPLPDASGDVDAGKAQWPLRFQLQCVDRPALVIDAADVWLVPGRTLTVEGRVVDGPHDLLLRELGRATKLYPRLERALDSATPSEMMLSTPQAYEFLREVRPVLVEQGFAVIAPSWWEGQQATKLGVRLRLESDREVPGVVGSGAASGGSGTRLGLGTLVRYRWDLAVGDMVMTLREFEKLALQKSPLVRINGRWVEIRPEDVRAAIKFVEADPGGEMSVGEALRTVYDADAGEIGVPVVGVEASGWVESLLNADAARTIEPLTTPQSFRGTLRPYQLRGLSWLAFVESVGLGACLADDMGLGKTIQMLALLAHERERGAQEGVPIGPTLLVAPTSVVDNWVRESARFCPDFQLLVHHGATRRIGPDFVAAASSSDIVVTTYSLAARDQEDLRAVPWRRVVLDEAQFVKNSWTKQTQAVRSIEAPRRVALTGTPVENRLAELWSIVDFLNTGYLGGSAQFRRKFAYPIERYHDRARSEQLRGLIRPFVLRRVKTDPTVIADLPEKIETRAYCHLTSEQASLYESCVRRMLTKVDDLEGPQRRGAVLAALIRLKQCCDHPGLLPGDMQTGPPEAARSGKCVRLLAMLEEIIDEGAQALVFSQFRQMGGLLVPMIQSRFDRDVLFLHGGTPQDERARIVERFQRADGKYPVLVLSLRAGGVGLNLTAATHVFHFDRWWNPAVENQATDRAYRIGQTRTVQVHKFVVKGTLEERIDEMLEQKSELASSIIGAGERWLTELSTDQLRSILELRAGAVDDEE